MKPVVYTGAALGGLLRCLLLVIGLVPAAVGAAPLQLELRPQAQVDSDDIRLADVARLQPPQPELEELRLGRAPNAGDSRSLDRAFIGRALLRAGLRDDQVLFSGAEQVVVQRRGNRLDPQQLGGYIDAFLQTYRERLPQASIRFVPLQEPETQILPSGRLEVEVQPSADNLLKSRSLTLVFRVDGRTVRTLALRGKVEVQAPVVVASRRLARGSLLSQDSLTLENQTLASFDDVFFDPRALIGMKLTRNLNAGQPVIERVIERPAIVTKGGFVRILARRGAMQLTATGIASEDGHLGETIRVRNSASEKEILARVIGPDWVEVEF